MSKRQLLILLGAWVMVYLFLGFPAAWDKIFALLTGAFIIFVAFKQKNAAPASSPRDVPYVEHKNGAPTSAPRMSDMNRSANTITSSGSSVTS